MAKQASAQQDYVRMARRSPGQMSMGMGMSMDMDMSTTLRMQACSFAPPLPPLPPGLSAGVFVGQAALLESCGGGNGGVDDDDYDDDDDDNGSSSLNNGNDGPLQHVEALRKKYFEQHRAELLAHAAGGQDAGESQKWVAQRWLVV